MCRIYHSFWLCSENCDELVPDDSGYIFFVQQAKKKEALKDRSTNVLHPTSNETKETVGQNDTSSRTQRAQFRKVVRLDFWVNFTPC